MRRRYRRRGAATFVNPARDRVDLAEVEKDLPNAMHGSRLTDRSPAARWLVIRRRRNRRWRKTTVQNRNPIRCLDQAAA